jgi:hypothetical protein
MARELLPLILISSKVNMGTPDSVNHATGPTVLSIAEIWETLYPHPPLSLDSNVYELVLSLVRFQVNTVPGPADSESPYPPKLVILPAKVEF